MTTRNRTEEFLKLRASHRPDLAHLSHSDKLGLLQSSQDGGASVEMGEPPEWLRFFQLIRHTQETIVNDQRTVEALQRKHLLVEFGSNANRDRAREAREIDDMLNATIARFESADADLKALRESYIEENLSGPDGGTQMQRRILHNVTQCLASELAALNRNVRESHRRYVKAMEKQSAARARSAGGAAQREIEDRLEEQAKMEQYLARGCTQEQVEAIMLNSKRVNDLDREYTTILHNIKALHDMFSDLHTMVVEQGTILDRIEMNMTKTYDAVQGAQKQIKKAQKHQEASSTTIMFMLLVVLCAGALLALFIKVVL